MGQGEERVDYLVFLWGTERVCQADSLTNADQEIQDWPVKIIFLGEVGAQLG